MKIQTRRFGEIEIDTETIISFPNGILGFPTERRYVLLDPKRDSALKWMQSVDNPELAFVVTDPLLFKPDYEVNVFQADLEDIEVEDATDVAQLVIVTVPRDPGKMTANMKGPLLVNLKNRKAKQIVLDDPNYDLKFRLLPDEVIEKAV
jgi:flagellar assembly factor FliW